MSQSSCARCETASYVLFATMASILSFIALQSVAQEVREVVLKPDPKNEKIPGGFCGACDSCDVQSISRSLLVIADFQSGQPEPCPTGKATIAAVQQWAFFDLLDLVQKDVRFGSVFVTDQAHVFRHMEPVLPTDRAEIRRKLMLARAKNGGRISDGLKKGIELLSAVPRIPSENSKVSLVLLLSRYPSDIDEIKNVLNDDANRELLKDAELHILATVTTDSVSSQLDALATSLHATFGAAHFDRELPSAMIHVYRQLKAFDQSFVDELKSIRAAIDKCCKEKAAVCKMLDHSGPVPVPITNDYSEILTLIRNEAQTINVRLDKIDTSINNLKLGNESIDLGPLKIELNTLLADLDKRIQLSLTRIEDKLTIIDEKIDGIKLVFDAEAFAKLLVAKLAGWFTLLLLLLLATLGILLFTAIVSRKIHTHVHHSKGHGSSGGATTGYDVPPATPKKPGSY